MKSHHADGLAFRKGSSSKFVSRYEHNKQNIYSHCGVDKMFSGKVHLNVLRQPLILPRRFRDWRAEANDFVGSQKASGLTLQPCTNRQRSKKPSIQLPQIQQVIQKNQSLQRNRIKKFYTEGEEEQIPKNHTIKQIDLMKKQLQNILHSRQALHNEQFSMDYEFAKLNALTKRCAVLRRDLVSVQSDLMTLNLTNFMLPQAFTNGLSQSDFEHFSKLNALHHILFGEKPHITNTKDDQTQWFQKVDDIIHFIGQKCEKLVICIAETMEKAQQLKDKLPSNQIVVICASKSQKPAEKNSFTRCLSDFKFNSTKGVFGFYEWLLAVASHLPQSPIEQQISEAFYCMFKDLKANRPPTAKYLKNLEDIFLSNTSETCNKFLPEISGYLAKVQKLTKKALIIVDPQNDFCEGGSLQVPNASAIFGPINEIKKKINFDNVIVTKDWHPENHVSFASTHNFNPFVTIEIEGQPQELWPDHCIQNTQGAEITPLLELTGEEVYVLKGTRENEDAYSGFGKPQNPTQLIRILEDNHIECVIVVGLAFDFCVGETAMDAHSAGFVTYIVDEATKPALSHSEEVMKLRLAKKNLPIISLDELFKRFI